MEKMTQKQLFTELLAIPAVQARPDLVQGLQTRLEALDKKASKSGLSADELQARADLEARILEVLDKPMRVTEVQAKLGGEFSTSKITARLTHLRELGKVERTDIDHKPHYAKVEA